MLTQKTVRFALSISGDLQLEFWLHAQPDLTRQEKNVLSCMHRLQADRAGGWPYIERAIGRNLIKVASSMTAAYYSNLPHVFYGLVDLHDLKIATREEAKAAEAKFLHRIEHGQTKP